MDMFVRAMQLRGLMLGQQLSAEEIQRQHLANQQQQITLQGQQSVLQAQQDPDWDPTDPQKALKVLQKHSVPVDAQRNVLTGINEYKNLLNAQSQDTLAEVAKAHEFFDNQFQAVKDASESRKQAVYDLGKRNIQEYVNNLPDNAGKQRLATELSNAPAAYDEQWVNEQHSLLLTAKAIQEEQLRKAQTAAEHGKAGQARAETQKVTQEAANLPTPQEAAAQRVATLQSTRAQTGRAQVETAKAAEELSQLKRQAASIGAPDPTGFSSSLPVAEYNKRYDAFAKSKGFQQLQTLQGSYSQFQSVLSDLDANKPMTGAASVVALFNAIGISAEPLAGKGFRINSSTIQEHVGARGLDQAAYQKLLSLKNGDIITPQQVKDYASIAADVYKNAYVQTANEAHRQGLPADFLPQGGGVKLDSTTAEIFARAVLHQNPGLAQNPAQLRAAVAQAARRNGWQVQ